MGKRRERRLAAMSAAGRRVKLDLFAEPSGEMVDKSSKDEIKGDPDHQDHHAGVPTSPSTSGQNQENPLLLLGQYSDDEVNDDKNGEPDTQVEGNLSTSAAQEGEDVDIGGNTGCTTDQGIDAGNIKKDVDEAGATNDTDGKDVEEEGILSEAGQKGTDLMAEACAPAALMMQIIGDVTDGWKMVMHEQTNQYYYWNTMTGETSWEVPDVLSHRVETSTVQNSSIVPEEQMGALGHVHTSAYVNVTAVDNGNDQLVVHVADTANGFVVEKENGASGSSMAYDTSQAAVHYGSSGIGSISYPEVLPPHSSASLAQSNAFSEHLACSGLTGNDSALISSSEVKDKHLLMSDGSFESTEGHSARLVKYGESLLQRLRMLTGSDGSVQRDDWSLKYTLEVETRLSDCKALSSYGSSLLPFWWHTETQLKQIECIIDQDGSVIHDCKSFNEDTGFASSLKPDSSLGNREHELCMKDNALSKVETIHCSETSMSKETIEQTSHAPKSEDAFSTKKPHSGALEVEVKETVRSPTPIPQPSGGIQEVQDKEEASASSVSVSQLSGSEFEYQVMYKNDKTLVSPKIGSPDGEDVDMDVEMEVDDEEAPAGLPTCGSMLHLEQLEQPVAVHCVAPLDFPSDSPLEENVPPPPDEEWIPPPPPEDEAIPPPPPEEPPIPCVPPPPYAENVPSFSYSEQYNVGYPISAFEYYAPPMSEAPTTTYYTHVEVSHVVEPQPPSYYDPVTASSFTETNIDANAAEPVVYYDVPVQIVPPIPVVSSLETSGFYMPPGSASYNDDNISAADNSGSVMVFQEYTNSLPTHKIGSTLPPAAYKPNKVIEPSAYVSTTQSTGAAVVNGTSSDTKPTANVKNQPKVARSKKRTVAVTSTLRSNKKVSSLVDKWKAAKEELHGDEEDEPENAYEVLEKKRQREIEVWKARQIASGEAQENANFLPLGGDWRERVKRRRAESNAQPTQTPPEEASNEKQQPDIVELSKDLPPGWQAYWDESSREVYYGNALTSETTWVRPSR
ncbi:hypothetical protein Taro_017227 [Colocasia esculenta]|uniref:WW domain-containing protein n=1 Tax=Colocasia esculenta TaxID=4460 RepID=A0A843UQW5_COLES|nr:hypothetical protein [Colocasia esculenta]